MNNVVGKPVSWLVAIGLSLVASLSAYALSDKQRAAVEERIQPVGSVCVQGDSACGNQAAAAAGGGAAKDPADIYNTYCTACHSTGVAGAPKVGDAAAWEERMAKGLEQVYAHAVNGFNGMPPKGTCMGCSEEEIHHTVDYMLEQSK